MPSTYAHLKLGRAVKHALPKEKKAIIQEYPELYLIGIHGPDILFYYHPLFPNAVNQVGYGTHAKSGREFFVRAAKVIRSKNGSHAHLSYIYGVIDHFALDVTCHGYIDEKIKKSGLTHTEIEVEFDRELLIEDGFDPLRKSLVRHIIPSMKSAEVICDFYPEVTAKQVYKALRGMRFNNALLLAPGPCKRRIIKLLFFLTGNYKEMHGLLMGYEKNPKCLDSNRQLAARMQTAQELACSLIAEFDEYRKGTVPLSDIYSYSFGTVRIC